MQMAVTYAFEMVSNVETWSEALDQSIQCDRGANIFNDITLRPDTGGAR